MFSFLLNYYNSIIALQRGGFANPNSGRAKDGTGRLTRGYSFPNI